MRIWGAHHNAWDTARISQNSLARDTVVHVGSFRNSENSDNLGGDTVTRGRGVCEPGGTKLLSTSTRCKVWRPAVGEPAPSQHASESVHDERMQEFCTFFLRALVSGSSSLGVWVA